MGEKQRGSGSARKSGGKATGGKGKLGPIRLKRQDRSFRTARADEGSTGSKAKGGKVTTGARRLRNQAAYARADSESARRIRSEIQAAVDAGNKIREQIEAKIEQGFKSDGHAKGGKAAHGKAKSGK